MDKRVLTDLAQKHGPRLVKQAVEQLLSDPKMQAEVSDATGKPGKPGKKPSLGRRLASAALVRVATRSVPGAILVSGGLIARALHERHKSRQALRDSGKRRG